MAIPDKPIKEIGWGFGFGGGGLPKAIVQPDNIDASMELIAGATFSADLIVEDFESGAGELIADSVFQGNAIYSTPSAAEIIAGAVFSGNMIETTNDPIAFDDHYWEEEDPSGTSGTFNLTGLTVASNNNRLLAAVITARNSLGAANTDISGVTWNSNALSERIEDLQIVNATRTEKMWLFDLTGVNVSTGNNTLAVSYTGSSNIDVLSVHVASYYNVTAGAGVYEHTNSAGVGVNSISDSITPASENSLIVVASMLADPTGTWASHDASLTQIADAGADAIQVCYSHDLDSSGSTLNYTETPSITNRRLSTVSAAYEQA